MGNAHYRCGIPMITLLIPAALDLSMMVLRAGMRTSQPSRPKRFSDDHFLARKSSNLDTITDLNRFHIWTTDACATNR